MRVAYFVESLPPNTDGISRVMERLVETLETKGVDYRLVSPFKDSAEPWSKKVLKNFSIPFPLYPQYRFSIPRFSNIFPSLDAFKPDLIHCVANPTPLGFHGLDYARSRGIPAVSSYQTRFVSYFKYYHMPRFLEDLGWNIFRRFHGRCEVTYVPSSSTGKELEDHGVENVELWGHGVDLKRFSPKFRNENLRKKFRLSDAPLLFCACRLVKEKDLEDLAEADRFLRAWGISAQWAIAGEGPFRKNLEKSMPRAFFTGLLGEKELSEWYASSDLFVFPSTTETFGLVVQEALASGLPVVGAKACGTIDLVKDGVNGLLADPKNPLQLARHIRNLLENGNLRKKLARQAPRLLNPGSWTTINEGLIRSYGKVLNRTKWRKK